MILNDFSKRRHSPPTLRNVFCALPFLLEGRKVLKVGVQFDRETMTILAGSHFSANP